jgi:futalosine hydrolase
MKILVVAATDFEIAETKLTFRQNKSIHFLITEVGMTLTAYTLTKELLTNKYDLVINAGIAGSFSKQISIGEVAAIENDFFAELGAENDEEFIPFPKMNLPGAYSFINKNTISSKTYQQLKKVKAATVNKVHGNEESITKFLSVHHVDIESMEGAAVAMVCEKENMPYFQIRSISNYVTKRNINEWNVPYAIKNLNSTLIKILNELHEN